MGFFGVIVRSNTWRNVGYLLMAFPLGLFYFIFLVTGFALGLGLIITLVGVPILVGMITAAYGLGEFERLITNEILEAGISHSRRLGQADGFWEKLKTLVTSSETWKRLFYLFLKFPLGIFSFVLIVVTFAAFAEVLAPFFYQQDWFDQSISDVWEVDSVGRALLVAAVGVFVGFILLHVVNGTARLWSLVAGALLGPAHSSAPDLPTPSD